jgi:hypothetical protein
MVDNSVPSASSVPGLAGFAGRQPKDPTPRPRSGDPQKACAEDRVSVHPTCAVALQILRERVLARTRALLELDDAALGPTFAEIVDGEPVPSFLGRLLSAQNLLAARRLPDWPAARVRQALVDGLQQGATEAIDLLAADEQQGDAVALVADVLALHARRIAALGNC